MITWVASGIDSFRTVAVLKRGDDRGQDRAVIDTLGFASWQINLQKRSLASSHKAQSHLLLGLRW